jgi:hypothetical protein
MPIRDITNESSKGNSGKIREKGVQVGFYPFDLDPNNILLKIQKNSP